MTDKDWYRARWTRERKLHKIWRAIARRRALTFINYHNAAMRAVFPNAIHDDTTCG